MKTLIFIIALLFSSLTLANGFSATCQGFSGIEYDAHLNKTAPFKMDDGTIYEFDFSSEQGGQLKYVIDGVGILEPKKEDRWHQLDILRQSSNHVAALADIADDYMLFTLYPNHHMLHIAWVAHPNKRYQSGNSFLIKVNCAFVHKNT